MNIAKSSVAGTLESSDAQVTIEPAENELDLDIQSSVLNQYGRQIKKVVLDTLANLKVTSGHVYVVDKGALDCTIMARVEGAVYRSINASEEGIDWGALK